MTKWTYSQSRDTGGYFLVTFTVPGLPTTEVTYFRDTPVEIQSYSSGDPFDDAVASLRFPQITGFDDFGSGELDWLRGNANVDIFYVLAEDDLTPEIIDSRNQQLSQGYDAGYPAAAVFQGFVASFDISQSENEASLQIQCQGALYQVDRLISKPFFPSRPYTNENLIARQLAPWRHPSLRTQGLKVEWPVGWAKTMPAGTKTIYTPMGAKAGEKITGYSTRQTGDFSRALTGYIQDLLAIMFTQDDSGVKPGDKWTLMMYQAYGDLDSSPNRRPTLQVRSSDPDVAPPDFEIYFGQIGVTMNLSQDISQATNVIYGEGQAIDGVEWKNTEVSPDGSETQYLPLAYNPAVYPESAANKNLDKGLILNETYIRYGTGVGQEAAFDAAPKQLLQFSDPGWTGTITLSIDPEGISRWRLRAGMNVRVKNLAGSGSQGVMMHIAECTASPQDGKVTLKVDSKYRDLLTLEEVVARTRDPLTPAKLLRINRRSITIEDTKAPWNYKAGSGYMPKGSLNFFRDLPSTTSFPWTSHAKKYPPGLYPQYYIKVDANARKREDRWTLGKEFPIILSERGTARLLQIAAFDRRGNQIKVAFHFSLYYVPVVPNDMPRDKNGPSPFIKDAFQTTDAAGNPFPTGYILAPQPTYIEGWGDSDQPAGYSPGRKSDGYAKTGRLTDEGAWTWDFNSNNPEFVKNVQSGKKNPPSAYTAYGALYCEYPEDVYFIGRIFRVEPS